MSKAGKRRAQQNKLKTRTKNQIRKTAYESMAGGKESRSAKRSRLKARRSQGVKTNNHQAGEGPACANVGCKRCFPHLNKPRVS